MLTSISFFVEDYWRLIVAILCIAALTIFSLLNLSTIKHEFGLDSNLRGLKISSVNVLNDKSASAVLTQELLQKGARIDPDSGIVITGELSKNELGNWALLVSTSDNNSAIAECPTFFSWRVYVSKIDSLREISSDIADKLTHFYHIENQGKELK